MRTSEPCQASPGLQPKPSSPRTGKIQEKSSFLIRINPLSAFYLRVDLGSELVLKDRLGDPLLVTALGVIGKARTRRN